MPKNLNPHMMQGPRESAPEWAQIEATRALAFEQARTADALETANLIAYLRLIAERGTPEDTPANIRVEIQRTIETRLGLA